MPARNDPPKQLVKSFQVSKRDWLLMTVTHPHTHKHCLSLALHICLLTLSLIWL
jgi:hypothetical protein